MVRRLRSPDSIGSRFHRTVYHGRFDGYVSRLACHRRAPERDVLHRGPLSLHHGGRRGHGLSWRTAFLVAKNIRTEISQRLGDALRGDYFYWSQSHIFSAIYFGISRHDPALRFLSGGVSGVEPEFLRLGLHSWHRVSVSGCLFF